MKDETPLSDTRPDSMTAPGSRRRDLLTAPLMIAAVIAIVAIGYHVGVPAPSAVPTSAIGNDMGGPLASIIIPAEAPGDYDLNHAMSLAGQEVPDGTESFYFFAFTDAAEIETETADLAQKMKQAATEHDFLAITGPDAARNRNNLFKALDANRGEDLGNLVLIYLGPEADHQAIRTAVEPTHATLRFIAYPKLDGGT